MLLGHPQPRAGPHSPAPKVSQMSTSSLLPASHVESARFSVSQLLVGPVSCFLPGARLSGSEGHSSHSPFHVSQNSDPPEVKSTC